MPSSTARPRTVEVAGFAGLAPVDSGVAEGSGLLRSGHQQLGVYLLGAWVSRSLNTANVCASHRCLQRWRVWRE